jgi:molybdopterin synthase catalytic subunit
LNKLNTKDIFIPGFISPTFIGDCIARAQSEINTGAHDIFLGQVRADKIEGKTVAAIEYTAYEEMAIQAFEEIWTSAYAKFDLTELQIYHSLGMVKAGEIGLFVFASSAHRNAAMEALRFTVEEIKAKVPVFGKEIFDDDSHQWKTNK